MLKVLLIVVQGKPEGKTIPIATPVFRVGRGEDCHLRPNSEEVSRRHTEFTVSDTEVTIRDLGSRNGTRVNGKRITDTHTLKSGELVQIGPLTFAVAIQGGAAAMPSQAQPSTPAAAGAKAAAPSLDDVPHDEIEAWLVSDNARPTPDRPSGVYDGDTLTIDAYREATDVKPKSSSSLPAAKVEPRPEPEPEPARPDPPAARIEPKPEPVIAKAPEPEPEDGSHFAAALEGYEHLPEGTGDVPTAEGIHDNDAEHETDEGEATENESEELLDESNPFFMPKKPVNAGAESAAKAGFKDTSDAASDILRRMLERRRGSRP